MWSDNEHHGQYAEEINHGSPIHGVNERQPRKRFNKVSGLYLKSPLIKDTATSGNTIGAIHASREQQYLQTQDSSCMFPHVASKSHKNPKVNITNEMKQIYQ